MRRAQGRSTSPILAGEIITPEFKEAGRPVYVFAPESDRAESQRASRRP